MKEATLLIKNVEVYTENDVITSGYILVNGTDIVEIGIEEQLEHIPSSVEVIDGKGKKAIPGFIDGHIHGANGADVMDATPEALRAMATILPKEGTTSFLATTITQSPTNIEHALKNVATYRNEEGEAEIIGVHLEGPFIEEKKAGAQPREYILAPSKQQFDEWQQLSGNKIKTITLAPEKDVDGSFINYLYEQGVNVSAGHTEASFEDMKRAVEFGVRQVTHICNAMTPIHHRDIGVVGAAFQLEKLRSELISDGIHVSPAMMDLIYQNVGSDRLMLITDALRAKCLQPGTYDLGGQEATVSEDRATLADGTLAGSILRLIDGAKNMIDYTDATMKQVIEMASTNPAKQLDVFDRKGTLAIGKDADIVVVDDELTIHYTICRGKISYKEGS
ncbi:N-acetylglucosamine-6-phosphate deacetylase [Aquibacillus sediminis]|uniref:N-acetylglucosamine-6-phosphate deacetylase n=1 Tax=Aquibacillus sediminis TaxID=2574734 RepID=UPI0011089904|nr:N-acetylglucosamine-6-phosphate deacetylase [Aquibacillus sediminis]